MLKLEWDVSDAESRIVRQAVTVMTHQAGRVPVKDNELGTQMTVSYPLKEEEELYDGDEYIIKVCEDTPHLVISLNYLCSCI